MLVLVAILMIVGPLAAILFAIGVPVFFGLMGYDLAKQRQAERAEQPATEPQVAIPVARVELERLTA